MSDPEGRPEPVRTSRTRAITALARRIPLVLAMSTVLVLATLVPTPKAARAARTAASARPNIVIVMTDDQRWDIATPKYMPNLNRILTDNPSITYTNAFVPNSLCCPSRASTLTGDYSHTTGVFGNAGTWGGFPSFTPPPVGFSTGAVNDHTTLAVDMHNAGYRTGLIGKYLNQYPGHHWSYEPPGWDEWFAVGTGVYYHYHAAHNGTISPLFGGAPQDYITHVLREHASAFIERPSAKPFFLYYSTTAPHAPAVPNPLDVGRFNINGYTQPPNFGKAEAGAPDYIKNLPWGAVATADINAFHVRQLDAIYGVDRSIGVLWSELPDNTVVLFMSDNGYEWGSHRWGGKQVSYNESLRIPMSIVGKNLATPLPTTGQDGRIVLNVDVLPTLEGLAGVTPGHIVEGLDMLTSARSEFVIEHWGDVQEGGLVPTYCGVRSADWMYVKYGDGEPVAEGLYDEINGPYEMNNLAVTDPTDPELQTLRDLARGLCRQSGGLYPPDWPF
jgi:N-acetylglucosamine-6-sulfatase